LSSFAKLRVIGARLVAEGAGLEPHMVLSMFFSRRGNPEREIRHRGTK